MDFKILFAQPIDAVVGELFAAQIDKEPMLISGFKIETVFCNVQIEQSDRKPVPR